MEGIEAFWKEKQWKRFFQKENLIVLLLSGVLLFIIAIPVRPPVTMELGYVKN